MPVKFKLTEKIQRENGFEVRFQQTPNSPNPTEQEKALCNGIIVLSNLSEADVEEYIPGQVYLLSAE